VKALQLAGFLLSIALAAAAVGQGPVLVIEAEVRWFLVAATAEVESSIHSLPDGWLPVVASTTADSVDIKAAFARCTFEDCCWDAEAKYHGEEVVGLHCVLMMIAIQLMRMGRWRVEKAMHRMKMGEWRLEKAERWR
jgi:hypothetical protein